MTRQRANDTIRRFHYNTRSSSRHESRGIAETAASASSLRVTRRRKEISDDRKQNFDLLPIDLVMEILKLLPIQTLARFLCVSKLWNSIIRRRDFMKLFLAESSSRPGRIFFSFNRQKEDCFIFSSLPVPGESSLATTYHVTHRASEQYRISSSCVHGLICYANASASRLVVYNSTSRRSVALPEFEPGSFVSRHFLGYDPVDGVYKVLCMTRPNFDFHVLTLGNGTSWKTIRNSPVHLPANSQIICINGVVYYEAYAYRYMGFKETMVVSFDVRCENFHVVKRPGGTDHHLHGIFSTLIRYEGKLAIMSTEIPANGNVDLWVLEDPLKHRWLKKVFVLPNSWTSLAEPISVLSHIHMSFIVLLTLLMQVSLFWHRVS